VKNYKSFKKFYIHGDKVCVLLVCASITATVTVAASIVALVFFNDLNIRDTGIRAFIFFLSLSVLLMLIILLLLISKVYVSDTEIIISCLKKENNGHHKRCDLMEIFIKMEYFYNWTSNRSRHYMVLCFNDKTNAVVNLPTENLTYKEYIELCNRNPKIVASTLIYHEKLLAELKRNYKGRILLPPASYPT